MTDRRRNLFVLLLVAGLLVASLVVIATKPTRLGLDLKGGVSLIYQAKPTKQSAVTGDAIDRSLDIMRKRVDQIGVAEPSLQRSGADQIDVSLPDVKNADEAASQVGTTAQMWFYDWEGSVLGPNCKPDPQNASGHRRAGGRRRRASRPRCRSSTPSRGARSARARTRARSPRATSSTSSTRSARRSSPGPTRPVPTCRRRRINKKLPFDAKQIVKVPQGTVIVRAEQADPKAKPPHGLVRARRTSRSSAARTSRTPSRTSTTGPGESGQPNVTFDFTGHGADVW